MRRLGSGACLVGQLEQFAYQTATALNNLGGYLRRICLAKDYGA